MGIATMSVHEKWFKRFTFADRFLNSPALVLKFTAKAGPAAVLLAGKLPFHSPLVGNKKALAPFTF